MNNMEIYEKLREAPAEALKPITAGRLKGMSDINPMWRIKALTEAFGPCGVGWWYEITEKRIIDDETTNQRMATVDINLYYVNPETGETSRPIPGTGGASLVAQERNGAYLSDEAFKMALTDAISVSCKALGMAANVYYANDRTKYTKPQEPQEQQEQPQEPPEPASAAQQEAPAQAEPASAAQIEVLRQMLTPEQWSKMAEKYGAKLEHLTKNAAGKALAKLKEMQKA